MKCGHLMETDVAWINGSATVSETAVMMRDRSLGFLVVSDPVPNETVGVVTDRDLALRVCAEGLNPSETRVGAIASIGLVVCNDDEDLGAAEERMAEFQKSRLVVLDSAGVIVGVLSLADILRGDRAGRAVKTANAVLAREGTPHTPIESIHLTASTPEDEEAAAVTHASVSMGGAHRGSMKEFPS